MDWEVSMHTKRYSNTIPEYCLYCFKNLPKYLGEYEGKHVGDILTTMLTRMTPLIEGSASQMKSC